MTLNEMYESIANVQAAKDQRGKSLTDLEEKAMMADELDAPELEKQVKTIKNDIADLNMQEKKLKKAIEAKEGAMKSAADTALEDMQEKKNKASHASDYLKTKQAMDDFANILLANAGGSRDEVKKAWEDNLAEKGITNPTILFPEPVVQAIQDTFEASGTIFATLQKHYGFTTWSNALNTITDDTGRAHQHTMGEDKMEQVITLEDKEIRCDFIYKYIVIPKKVLRETQSTGAVIRYVLAELPQRIVMEIERAAIIGDGRASGADGKISCYEAITAAEDDYMTSATATTDFYADVVTMLSEITAPGPKYLVMSKKSLADLKLAKDNTGAYLLPIGADMAYLLGVTSIFTPDWFAAPAAQGDVKAVAYAGDSYIVIGDSIMENYENFVLAKNENEYLAELYTGGALMIPNSAAVLLEGAAA